MRAKLRILAAADAEEARAAVRRAALRRAGAAAGGWHAPVPPAQQQHTRRCEMLPRAAARRCGAARCRRMLAVGVDKEARDATGKTALDRACDKGHPKIARLLLAADMHMDKEERCRRDGLAARAPLAPGDRRERDQATQISDRPMNTDMTGRIQKSKIDESLAKSLVQHHQTRMTLSFPTVLSAPPSESEKREVPIQHSTMSTAHISQHTALELRAKQGRVHGRCSCSRHALLL